MRRLGGVAVFLSVVAVGVSLAACSQRSGTWHGQSSRPTVGAADGLGTATAARPDVSPEEMATRVIRAYRDLDYLYMEYRVITDEDEIEVVVHMDETRVSGEVYEADGTLFYAHSAVGGVRNEYLPESRSEDEEVQPHKLIRYFAMDWPYPGNATLVPSYRSCLFGTSLGSFVVEKNDAITTFASHTRNSEYMGCRQFGGRDCYVYQRVLGDPSAIDARSLQIELWLDAETNLIRRRVHTYRGTEHGVPYEDRRDTQYRVWLTSMPGQEIVWEVEKRVGSDGRLRTCRLPSPELVRAEDKTTVSNVAEQD